MDDDLCSCGKTLVFNKVGDVFCPHAYASMGFLAFDIGVLCAMDAVGAEESQAVSGEGIERIPVGDAFV